MLFNGPFCRWFYGIILTSLIPFLNNTKKFEMTIFCFQLSYYLLSFAAAKKLSASIISEKLAACVNIVPGGNCVLSLCLFCAAIDT